MKGLFIISILGLTAYGALGQMRSSSQPLGPEHQGFVLRGTVRGDQAARGLYVQLVPGNPERIEKVQVNPDGTFEFRSAVPGTHEVVVSASNGEILYEEYVFISGSTDFLTIQLRASLPTSDSEGKTVSIQELQHHVSRGAQHAFFEAQRSESKGDAGEAVKQLQRALAIDPGFADAHNELGVIHASAGNLVEACKEFQKAIDIFPDHKLALANLSVTLGRLERYDEAAAVAARALRIDPSNAKVHFILAISLIKSQKDSTTALRHLDEAAPEISLAYIVAADLLSQTGRPHEAVSRLEKYLGSARPKDPHRARVEARIEELTRQEAHSEPR